MPSFSQIERLEGGWNGTAQTIRRMHRLVAMGKLDPTMHQLATWLRRNYSHTDYDGHRRALWSFLRDCGLFQRDPYQVERIEHPLEAIKAVVAGRLRGLDDWAKPGALFVGDCDLFSIMAGTVGGLWGFPYAFETVKGDSNRPDDFSHVFPLVHFPDKGYVAFDATVDESSIGWRPPIPEDRCQEWPEPPIEGTGVSGLHGAFQYMPVENRSVFPMGRPIRARDIASPPDQAKAIADEVVRNVTAKTAYPPQFFDNWTFDRRGSPVLPAANGFPSRAAPYLPTIGEDDDLPLRLEVAQQASDRPPTPPDFQQYPRYHENPDLRVAIHEGLAPRFIYANQVVNKEQYDPGYTLPYLKQNVVVPRGGPDMADYRAPTLGRYRSGLGAVDLSTADFGGGAVAATAGASVWDIVGGTIDKLLAQAPAVVTAKITADMQKQVLDAQKKVLDAQAANTAATAAAKAAAGGTTPMATPSSGGFSNYVKPLAIAGGVAVLGYGVYRLTRPKRRR